MNIIQQPDSFSFSSEVKDIILSSAKNVNVSIRCSGSPSFLEETYVPDQDGRIYIRDLGKLFDPYLLPAMLKRTFRIVLTEEGSQAVTVSVDVLYCQAEIGMSVEDFTKNYFLSLLKQEKQLFVGQAEYLSVYDEGSVELRLMATRSNGVVYTSIWTLSCNGNVVTKDISPGIWLPEPENVLYIVATCGNRTMIYYLTPQIPSESVQFLFLNSFGVKETFIPSGLISRENKYEAGFGYVSGLYRKYKNKRVKEYTVNTGVLDNNHSDWLEDLFISKDVFLLSPSGVEREIVIEDTKVKRSNTPDELPSFEFKYRFSKNSQGQFITDSTGIFDDTFDDTFN